ncbi:MAG: OsmC family protein [Rhodobacterales bacterium]|nr:OsmC family protein [Rhodobacterales bacterium]
MTTTTIERQDCETSSSNIAVFETNATWRDGLRTDVNARQFMIPVDEPPELGGADSAPNPMELLLAGLDGCLAVMIRVVAAEYGAEVTAIRLVSQGALDVRGFLGTAAVQPYFHKVHTRIEVATDLAAENFDAFTHAVHNRCPAGTLIEAAGIDFTIDWIRV